MITNTVHIAFLALFTSAAERGSLALHKTPSVQWDPEWKKSYFCWSVAFSKVYNIAIHAYISQEAAGLSPPVYCLMPHVCSSKDVSPVSSCRVAGWDQGSHRDRCCPMSLCLHPETEVEHALCVALASKLCSWHLLIKWELSHSAQAADTLTVGGFIPHSQTTCVPEASSSWSSS